MTNNKWFDKPFDRLTVLSKVEGLTTLSQVEGQYPNSNFQTIPHIPLLKKEGCFR